MPKEITMKINIRKLEYAMKSLRVVEQDFLVENAISVKGENPFRIFAIDHNIWIYKRLSEGGTTLKKVRQAVLSLEDPSISELAEVLVELGLLTRVEPVAFIDAYRSIKVPVLKYHHPNCFLKTTKKYSNHGLEER